MRLFRLLVIGFSLIGIFVLFACGGGGGGDSFSQVPTGTLAASMTDSAGPYKAVYVTVKELQVHLGGNENNNGSWRALEGFSKKTINLRSLTNGVFEDLGTTVLTAGHYTQLRLILCDDNEGPVQYDENNEPVVNILGVMHPYANYVVFDDDTWEMLEVPSAFKSGVKLVKGFDINPEMTTEVKLDFDAYNSVVAAGHGKKWQLKPTIQVLSDDQENWILDGNVTSVSSGSVGAADVLVSVQYPDPEDPKKIVRTSTMTDANGDYMIFVAPPPSPPPPPDESAENEQNSSGITGYNVVAYKGPRTLEVTDSVDGADILGPQCVFIRYDAQGIGLTNNFALEDSSISDFGYVTGTIKILNAPNVDEARYVTLSFRTNCSASSKEIEVLSVNLSEDTDKYRVALPVGTYNLVVSSGDAMVSYNQVIVSDGVEKTQGISLDMDPTI